MKEVSRDQWKRTIVGELVEKCNNENTIAPGTDAVKALAKHTPQLLIKAEEIQGLKITGYKSFVHDIKNAGTEYLDQEVVEDVHLVSSRDPEDLPAFIRTSLRRLEN